MPRSRKGHSTPVKDLFAVYRARLQAPQASVVKEVVVVVQEVTGIAVTIDQFTYNVHTKAVSAKVPSVIRSELQYKHTEIRKRLVERLGEKSAPDIIL